MVLLDASIAGAQNHTITNIYEQAIFRCIVIGQITLGQMLEYRAMPFVSGGQIWRDAFGIKSYRFFGFAVNNQKLAI